MDDHGLVYGIKAHNTCPVGVEDMSPSVILRSRCQEFHEVLVILTKMDIPYEAGSIRPDSRRRSYYLIIQIRRHR